MNLQREQVGALLLQQATLLDVKVLEEGKNYTYTLEIDGEQYQACALSSSCDYYRYRLNLNSMHLTMLVVSEHTTCVPIATLALDEGYFYAPAEIPRWYDPQQRRTRRDAMVVVGGLLCGVDNAWAQVNEMKRSTRYRYLANMKSYLSHRPGRELAV